MRVLCNMKLFLKSLSTDTSALGLSSSGLLSPSTLSTNSNVVQRSVIVGHEAALVHNESLVAHVPPHRCFALHSHHSEDHDDDEDDEDDRANRDCDDGSSVGLGLVAKVVHLFASPGLVQGLLDLLDLLGCCGAEHKRVRWNDSVHSSREVGLDHFLVNPDLVPLDLGFNGGLDVHFDFSDDLVNVFDAQLEILELNWIVGGHLELAHADWCFCIVIVRVETEELELGRLGERVRVAILTGHLYKSNVDVLLGRELAEAEAHALQGTRATVGRV